MFKIFMFGTGGSGTPAPPASSAYFNLMLSPGFTQLVLFDNDFSPYFLQMGA